MADKAGAPVPQPEAAARRVSRRRRGRLECQLGVLFGVLGLIASRLGQLWVSFDVFSQVTLQFAIVTIAFAIGWLVPRGRHIVAFSLLVLGLVAIGMWPHVASRAPALLGQAGEGQRALKVASFNTLWTNDDADAVKAEIERIDADVITLIEMSPPKRRILAALKARYPHQAECYNLDYCNLVVLSKLPIVDSEAHGAGKLGGAPSFIRVRLGPEGGGLNILGVHTIRFPHSAQQYRQVAVLAGLIEKLPGPKLVMGDFNATPFSRILATLEESANLRRLTFLPSWPAKLGLPQIAIDHIFVSPGLRQLEAASIGEPAGSDHYPVTTRIAVPLAGVP
jgi:endonuclease/exonuclease/phosphatase (EEP) superfamily protein YafD